MTTPDYATKHRWQNRVRWTTAHWLNKVPGTCWSNLVSWALHWRPLWSRYGDGDIRQDSLCRRDPDECGTCYCGKLRGGAS